MGTLHDSTGEPDAEANFTVVASHAGKRLDHFLFSISRASATPAWLSGLSRSRLQGLILDGHVRVNLRASKPARKLKTGDCISLRLPAPQPTAWVPEAVTLDILYEDSDLVVVNKPPGMVVHPGAGQDGGTLVHALLAHCGDLSGIGGALRPGIVHRLDRGTSGAIVAAKNDRAHVALAEHFARRRVVKEYVACAYGSIAPPHGTIDTPWGRHPRDRKRFTGRVEGGRRAVTHYRTRARAHGLSWLHLRIATGRTHQIRVHLSELGHPIVGDALYCGRRRRTVLQPAKQAVSVLERQALHARMLRFDHPTTGQVLQLEAPMPPDMELLAQLF